MTPVLEARGLAVARGGVQVLWIPELALTAGSVLALIGPNGSGKTTLLKTLAGLLPHAEGELRFQGQPLDSRAGLAAYRQRVTMVFQQPLLFDGPVRMNLEAGLRLRRLPAPAREARVQEVARRFGIAHLLERQARKLSGGEAQRTSLARAFALEPELLFLDEPFSALDPPTREGLMDDLARALRQTRTTAVLATHDQTEALRLADRLAVMHHGRVVQTGSGAEVVNRPADAFVAAFVGMETLLPGRVSASAGGLCRVAVGGCEVEALSLGSLEREAAGGLGAAVLVGVRPEHVTLAARPDPGSSARNCFQGTVTRIVPRGPYFKVELDCGFFLAAFITPDSLERLGLAPGSAVVASFKATAAHLIAQR